MKPIWRHLSYANVLATLALVFAMSGGALAASHYPDQLDQTDQPEGAQEAQGEAGQDWQEREERRDGRAHGATGATADWTDGHDRLHRAKPVSQRSRTLPSGASESGTFGLGAVGGKAGETLETSASFPIPLAEDAPEGKVITTLMKTPVTTAAGRGRPTKALCASTSTNPLGSTRRRKSCSTPRLNHRPGDRAIRVHDGLDHHRGRA